MDSEQVVNAILEENLPPILSKADRSASTSVELGSSSNSIENNPQSTFEPKEKRRESLETVSGASRKEQDESREEQAESRKEKAERA